MSWAHAVEFFDRQFRRQVAEGDFALNPFERLALPYIHGQVLDLGCGLGNLALEAARRGCEVRAIDGSSVAIARLQAAAAAEGLPIEALQADLTGYEIEDTYDTVISIGLLMFFHETRAKDLLDAIQRAVHPGGVAVVNTLVEGTTYMEMFGPDAFYLFGDRELDRAFWRWDVLESQPYSTDDSGGTVKLFQTVVAMRPRLGGGIEPKRSGTARPS